MNCYTEFPHTNNMKGVDIAKYHILHISYNTVQFHLLNIVYFPNISAVYLKRRVHFIQPSPIIYPNISVK